MIKSLIQQRKMSFLRNELVEKATPFECDMILKTSGYFRNYKIFKTMYNLIYKSRKLSLDQYKNSVEFIKSYLGERDDDYIVKGFCKALAKSNMSTENKRLFAIMVYKQIFRKGKLFDLYTGNRYGVLCKSIGNYYNESKNINTIMINKSKDTVGIIKINNGNILKFLFSKSWNH